MLFNTYPETQEAITVAEVQVLAFNPHLTQVDVVETVVKKYPSAQAETVVIDPTI